MLGYGLRHGLGCGLGHGLGCGLGYGLRFWLEYGLGMGKGLLRYSLIAIWCEMG